MYAIYKIYTTFTPRQGKRYYTQRNSNTTILIFCLMYTVRPTYNVVSAVIRAARGQDLIWDNYARVKVPGQLYSPGITLSQSEFAEFALEC